MNSLCQVGVTLLDDLPFFDEDDFFRWWEERGKEEYLIGEQSDFESVDWPNSNSES